MDRRLNLFFFLLNKLYDFVVAHLLENQIYIVSVAVASNSWEHLSSVSRHLLGIYYTSEVYPSTWNGQADAEQHQTWSTISIRTQM